MRRSPEGQPIITIPERGIQIIAPPAVARIMEGAQQRLHDGTRLTPDEASVLWPEAEKERIKLIKKDGTLKKRYPTPKTGREFMTNVDYERRIELYKMAKQLSAQIIDAWSGINQNEDISIILFGSVARGLTKRTDHPDPSNIDIAVIGNIKDDEKEKLYDAIRPHRKSTQEQIRSAVPFICSGETNPGNAGVCIQSIEKVRHDNLEPVRNYIASCAMPLYDPRGIWADLSEEALHPSEGRQKRTEKRRISNGPLAPVCTVFERT